MRNTDNFWEPKVVFESKNSRLGTNKSAVLLVLNVSLFVYAKRELRLLY